MADRPILFSAPMVRALLAGTKTQTRRVVKGIKQPGHTDAPMSHAPDEAYLLDGGPTWRFDYLGGVSRYDVVCPYGKPGDRLWVREAWKAHTTFDHLPPRDIPHSHVWYMADDGYKAESRYRQGMFMPRWASRITLEITDVRVEKLGDLSESDARQEGVASRDEFIELWKSINGQWEPETWTWVLQFRKV